MTLPSDFDIPWKILLVDDNDDDLFLIQDILADEWSDQQPPSVFTASTFEEAVSKVETDSFDLFLFDYRLGCKDGLDLLETVRNRGCLVPVILLTGQGDEELAVAAMKAGAADYIPKHRLTPELLQHAVRYAIEMHRAEILRAKAEQALKESEERYRELVTTIPAAICELAPDGTILYVNPAVTEISGYREDELLGGNWWDVFKINAVTRQQIGDITCRHTPDRVRRFELTIQARDGSRRTLNWNISCRFDAAGGLQLLVCVGVDISELVQLREELKELAITDELTGLFNRRGFMILAAHQVRLAQRQQQDLYLVFADLDNMKLINDAMGHEQGDAALRTMSTLLRETFRESDVIGRLGGDEFAVLVAAGGSCQDCNGIRRRLAENLARQEYEAPFRLEASIGVARLPAGEKVDLDQLLKAADDLMYEEKKRRRAARRRDKKDQPR